MLSNSFTIAVFFSSAILQASAAPLPYSTSSVRSHKRDHKDNDPFNEIFDGGAKVMGGAFDLTKNVANTGVNVAGSALHTGIKVGKDAATAPLRFTAGGVDAVVNHHHRDRRDQVAPATAGTTFSVGTATAQEVLNLAASLDNNPEDRCTMTPTQQESQFAPGELDALTSAISNLGDDLAVHQIKLAVCQLPNLSKSDKDTIAQAIGAAKAKSGGSSDEESDHSSPKGKKHAKPEAASASSEESDDSSSLSPLVSSQQA